MSVDIFHIILSKTTGCTFCSWDGVKQKRMKSPTKLILNKGVIHISLQLVDQLRLARVRDVNIQYT